MRYLETFASTNTMTEEEQKAAENAKKKGKKVPKKVSYAKFYLGRVNPMANPDVTIGGSSDRHNLSMDISMMTESPGVMENKGLLRKSGHVQDDSANDISPTTQKKPSKGSSTTLDEFTMMNFEQKFRRAAELQIDFDRQKRRELLASQGVTK